MHPPRILPLVVLLLLARPSILPAEAESVRVSIFEGLPDPWEWTVGDSEPTATYEAPAMGFPRTPAKYSERGIGIDRSKVFALRAETTLQVDPGPYRFVLRTRGAARLLVDGEILAETRPVRPGGSAHEHVPDLAIEDPRWLIVRAGDQEQVVDWESDGQPHRVELWALIGEKDGKIRQETGNLSVSLVAPEGVPTLIGSDGVPLTETGWKQYVEAESSRLRSFDNQNRRLAAEAEAPFWEARHALARAEAARLAPEGREHIKGNLVDHYLVAKRAEAGVEANPPVDDAAFLRRLSLDTIGLIPEVEVMEAFLADDSAEKRERAIADHLADPRWADHWVSYWQDVLAENPRILKPTLNNTGPFRQYLLDAFADNKPFDQFATELIRMEGDVFGGSPAGFGMAAENDMPMAAKAHILAKAFLGADMQCARCHDAPFRPYEQEDLFGLAAMLSNKSVKVPESSTVPVEQGGREPAISMTLMAGDEIEPFWNEMTLGAVDRVEELAPNQARPRDRLAATITSPRNHRFARVIVNRLWQRTMGIGLVEPVDDWDDLKATPSHPELLDALAAELLAHDYDLKHVARLIFESRAYQAKADPGLSPETPAKERRFAGPARRRLTPEQMLDSLFVAAGKEFGAEMLCLDPDGRRPARDFLNLGVPKRAWQFTSLSNERDRPALALPVAQTMLDFLETFGWRPDRQDPLTARPTDPTPLQPAVLANGVAHTRIARLSDNSALTELCLQDQPVDDLIRAVYLRILSRIPSETEAARLIVHLEDVYSDRARPEAPIAEDPTRLLRSRVSWANHLSPEATAIQNELERILRAGDIPTERLTPEFRERMEDIVWALINSPEFAFVP
ncbi:hypothetical protein BH23PLA1_BH23PLA1_16910 [soil metagenome]